MQRHDASVLHWLLCDLENPLLFFSRSGCGLRLIGCKWKEGIVHINGEAGVRPVRITVIFNDVSHHLPLRFPRWLHVCTVVLNHRWFPKMRFPNPHLMKVLPFDSPVLQVISRLPVVHTAEFLGVKFRVPGLWLEVSWPNLDAFCNEYGFSCPRKKGKKLEEIARDWSPGQWVQIRFFCLVPYLFNQPSCIEILVGMNGAVGLEVLCILIWPHFAGLGQLA